MKEHKQIELLSKITAKSEHILYCIINGIKEDFKYEGEQLMKLTQELFRELTDKDLNN